MNLRIADVAAQVANTLYYEGDTTVGTLLVRVKGATPEEVLLAVGWLVGEDRVNVTGGSGGDLNSMKVYRKTDKPTQAPADQDGVRGYRRACRAAQAARGGTS